VGPSARSQRPPGTVRRPASPRSAPSPRPRARPTLRAKPGGLGLHGCRAGRAARLAQKRPHFCGRHAAPRLTVIIDLAAQRRRGLFVARRTGPTVRGGGGFAATPLHPWRRDPLRQTQQRHSHSPFSQFRCHDAARFGAVAGRALPPGWRAGLLWFFVPANRVPSPRYTSPAPLRASRRTSQSYESGAPHGASKLRPAPAAPAPWRTAQAPPRAPHLLGLALTRPAGGHPDMGRPPALRRLQAGMREARAPLGALRTARRHSACTSLPVLSRRVCAAE
jgi:hypothetical protein